MEKLILTYNQVDLDIKGLAKRIFLTNSPITTIVAITRGGMYPALKLSQLLGIKDIRTICLESYTGQESGKIQEIFCSDIVDCGLTLFIDDLWDTGGTINYIKERFPNSKTAVIYYKSENVNEDSDELTGNDVDFVGKVIQKGLWVDFPWEEEKTLKEISVENSLKSADLGIKNFREYNEDVNKYYSKPAPSYICRGSKKAKPMDLTAPYKSYQGFELSDEQKSTIKMIEESWHSLFLLTGKAGAGKSTIIKELLHRNPNWAICSTTGRSALLIGGCTVDKFFAYNRDKDCHFSEYLLQENMQTCGSTVIIDEASMMGKKMFETCYTACIRYGKRLVLVGDWGQASPVKDEWIFKSKIFLPDVYKLKLTEDHRQAAGEFLEVLAKVRNGIVDEQVDKLLSSRVFSNITDEELDDKLVIFSTNASVDGYNQQKVHEFSAKSGNPIFQLHARATKINPLLKFPEEKAAQNIKDSCFADGEDLCLGCKVLITRNNSNEGYVNGDTGVLVSQNDQSLQVRLDRNNHNINVSLTTLEIKDAQDKLEMCITGFPIRCGYAFTVHKCQGLTIPKVFVCLDGIIRSKDKHGLSYVAFSRVRNIQDLYLSKWSPNAVGCDDITKPYL